jgi:addiction module HigA family antidote
MAKKILISVGDILKEEYLDPLQISAYRLAREIGVSTSLMSQIIRGKTAVSADIAWRLGQFFDTSAQYWLNMQASCDSRRVEEKYSKIKPAISSYKQFAMSMEKEKGGGLKVTRKCLVGSGN